LLEIEGGRRRPGRGGHVLGHGDAGFAVGGGGDAEEAGERVPALGDEGVRAAGEVGGGGGGRGGEERGARDEGDAACLGGAEDGGLGRRVGVAVSMGEATQGTASGTRRERRVERATASAGKWM